MRPKSIEIFGVNIINRYTDNIIDMILQYINNDPNLKKEYLDLIEDYGQ